MKRGGLAIFLVVALLSLSLVSALGSMVSMNVDKRLNPGDVWYLGGNKTNIFSLVYESYTATTAKFVLKHNDQEADSRTMNIGESYAFLFGSSGVFNTTFLEFSANSAELRNNFINSTWIESAVIPDLTLLWGSSEKKTLATGESWDVLGGIGGYRIIAVSIDARSDPRQAWLVLTKDCVKKDDLIVQNGKYANFTISGGAVLGIYVDSMFAGATSDMIQLKYVSISKDTDVFNPTAVLKKENWQCSEWGLCDNINQTRTCTDLNNCGGTYGIPILTQNCTISVCTEDWTCADWGACIGGQKRRACADHNNCGTNEDKPELTQNCSLYNDAQVGGENIIIKNDSGNNTILIIGQDSVQTNLETINKDSKIYVTTGAGTNEVKITPEIARIHVPEGMNVREIKIEEYKLKAVYVFYGTVEARLLLLFPVLAEVKVGVNVEDGKLTYLQKPWWAFLASGI